MALRLVLCLVLGFIVVFGVQPNRANALISPPVVAACDAVAELANDSEAPRVTINIQMLDAEPDSSLQFDGIAANTFAFAAGFSGPPSIVWVERSRAILIGPDPYPPRSLAL